MAAWDFAEQNLHTYGGSVSFDHFRLLHVGFDRKFGSICGLG